MTQLRSDTLAVLTQACAQAGLDPAGAQPVRLSENITYRLPDGVIARIGRVGQHTAATVEVRISQWLAQQGVPAVQALDSVEQPVLVHDRPVTFWENLGPHQHGTPEQVADALRRLHDQPIPDTFDLPALSPFVRLAERIEAAPLPDEDREWLRRRLADLQHGYTSLPPGRAHCVIHGDAWLGNVVATPNGTVVLLDLERCSIGPPEWDLTSTATKLTTLAGITPQQYQAFCHRYGYDVTTWAGFELLRDIRELRMACYLAQHAAEHPDAIPEAQHRLACLQGHRGPRPWTWTAAT